MAPRKFEPWTLRQVSPNCCAACGSRARMHLSTSRRMAHPLSPPMWFRYRARSGCWDRNDDDARGLLDTVLTAEKFDIVCFRRLHGVSYVWGNHGAFESHGGGEWGGPKTD